MVSDEEINEVDIHEVLIMNELLDDFPKELLGLLLDQKVEFTINLLLGLEPISIPIYRMALVELKELKEQ